jgi:hypothetical protein
VSEAGSGTAPTLTSDTSSISLPMLGLPPTLIAWKTRFSVV